MNESEKKIRLEFCSTTIKGQKLQLATTKKKTNNIRIRIFNFQCSNSTSCIENKWNSLFWWWFWINENKKIGMKINLMAGRSIDWLIDWLSFVFKIYINFQGKRSIKFFYFFLFHQMWTLLVGQKRRGQWIIFCCFFFLFSSYIFIFTFE